MGIQIAQFLLALSLLIVLHEAGHFIPAKIFKTRVEKFMLFFDPWFAIFKKKIGGTTYGLGWLPLGGYVKISGMVDESMDTEALKKDPEPWEFRAKPGWQRLIILSGGVIVNFVFGYLIYAAILFTYGTDYLANSELRYGIHTNEIGNEFGIKNGDKIVSVAGEKIEKFGTITKNILLGADGDLVLDRNGELITIPITDSLVGLAIANQDLMMGMFRPRIYYVAGGFSENSTAKVAGLQVNDSIVGFNGHSMFLFDEFIDSIPQYANKNITLQFYRDGSISELTFPVDSSGYIGVSAANTIGSMYSITHIDYSVSGAMVAAVTKTKGQLVDYMLQFKKLIFRPETKAYKKVGGFLTMLEQYDKTWDWRSFWELTAFISLMLGFLNILPIPALDGGHIVFVLIEMITGRKPSIKVLEVAQTIGFFMLLALLIFANGQDIIRKFF